MEDAVDAVDVPELVPDVLEVADVDEDCEFPELADDAGIVLEVPALVPCAVEVVDGVADVETPDLVVDVTA